VAAQFDLFEAPAWTPRYNITPTQEALVVARDPATARRQARRHRWRLIPSWAKDPSIQEVDRPQPLLRPYPDEGMVAYPVSRVVNNPANDDPRCIEPQQ
jgi:putative SOS response-associated peptidase YedK